MSIYFNNPWKPVQQTILKDENIKSKVDEIGFDIQKVLSNSQIEELQAILRISQF